MIHEITNLIDPMPLRPSSLKRRTNPRWPKPMAWAFTAAVILTGYQLMGPVPAMLFAAGYLGGLVLWLTIPSRHSFQKLRAPYYLTLLIFILHKMEEQRYGFFPALSELTGVATPDLGMPLAKLLYGMAAAWLLIPFLLRHRHPFGYYLAWTFFASMGITELAHFVFPFLTPGTPSYFPGLITATLLAPAGWWGLWRMWSYRAGNGISRNTAGITPPETSDLLEP